jgi:L-amino acid N-acyltransferase YncA
MELDAVTTGSVQVAVVNTRSSSGRHRHRPLISVLWRIAVPDQSDAFPVGPRSVESLLIRPMLPADAPAVLAVYQAGLDTGQASFETVAPAWDAFDAARLPAHRHVAADVGTGEVLGWAAVSAVSGRPVYAGVVEHSVYVHLGHHRRGVGAALLGALTRSSEAAGIWTIQSSVFPENTASLALHERAGFRVVGVRERVGRHHGRWRDTVLIERRSKVAGTS